MSQRALVCGAGGFIGGHLVKRLKAEGYWVRGVDLVAPAFAPTAANDFLIADLRDPRVCHDVVTGGIAEVYQLAADMGGAGYTFSGTHDADIMHNSATINLNMAEACRRGGVAKIFYSSSACIYPEHNQLDPENPNCEEHSAYPASPDSDYGWEKLFSERMYLACARNYGLEVRIARFHNIFGPEGAWTGGREKAPSAVCRKVAEAADGGAIELWGDGKQTRSFLYVDECLEGVRRLMRSDVAEPLNIGSDEMISMTDFARLVIGISGKRLDIRYVPGPQGVRGRNSDNRLIRATLGWAPSRPLAEGTAALYAWIRDQVEIARR
jgi:nucleoside-diphosphate-sugar epimerase